MTIAVVLVQYLWAAMILKTWWPYQMEYWNAATITERSCWAIICILTAVAAYLYEIYENQKDIKNYLRLMCTPTFQVNYPSGLKACTSAGYGGMGYK